jgi:hypothetical protein
VGSQLKKLRRALPPAPSRPNLSVSIGGQPGTAPYRFSGYPEPAPGRDPGITVTAPPGVEVGPVELVRSTQSAPTASTEALKPREPGMRPRPSARNTLPLLAMLALLGTDISMGGGRDRG